jgi:PRTRC genetic system protein B
LKTAIQEKPHLTLRFYSFGILLRKRTDKGWTEYPVRPEGVAAALAREVTFDTGLLGPNTLCVVAKGPTRVVAEHRPRQKSALWLEGAENPLRVPLPDLVLIRTVHHGRQPGYQLWAVKERPTSPDCPLFVAPFPNVYTHGGICWGTVERPQGESLEGADLAADWAQILGSRFGSHNVRGRSRAHPDDVRQQYVDLERRRARVYPKKDLVDAGRTLGQALEKALA